MSRHVGSLLVVLLTATSFTGWIDPAAAAGPWRGQVVDAETNQPLEGVIVLAQWDKLSPGAIHVAREFHDVEEVVTDSDGRFVIPERRVLTANPFVRLDGPILHTFKPGYGRWRTLGLPKYTNIDDMRRLMEKQEVVFALSPVRTVEERRRALPSPPSDAPETKIPRFMDAIDDEAIRLGLSPLRKR